MPNEEKFTYVGYREGFDPQVLNLGSLVFDFANPRFTEPYVHEKLNADELELWTLADQRENCWLTYSTGKQCSFGGGMVNLAELNMSKETGNYNLVVAEKGSKVEILKPTKFFEEVTLKSEPARSWLESRLAISKKLRYYYKMTREHPSIWLLTGIYLMKDANSLSLLRAKSGSGGAITVPLPDPAGITAILQTNPGMHWKDGSGFVIGGGSKFVGHRIWAAQYHRVLARYVNIKDGVHPSPKQLRLLHVLDLKTSRGESAAADLELDRSINDHDLAEETDSSRESEQMVEQFSDAYWKKFNEEVQDLKDEYDLPS